MILWFFVILSEVCKKASDLYLGYCFWRETGVILTNYPYGPPLYLVNTLECLLQGWGRNEGRSVE